MWEDVGFVHFKIIHTRYDLVLLMKADLCLQFCSLQRSSKARTLASMNSLPHFNKFNISNPYRKAAVCSVSKKLYFHFLCDKLCSFWSFHSRYGLLLYGKDTNVQKDSEVLVCGNDCHIGLTVDLPSEFNYKIHMKWMESNFNGHDGK
jgi:hypothetical protein